MPFALAALSSMVLAAGAMESRLFIAAGGKTEAEAKELASKLVLPPALVLAPGYPKLVDSRTVKGLNPGFTLVVLGACADNTAAQQSHSNGLAALIQRGLKGAYAKPVANRDAASCPLWLEPSEAPLAEAEALRSKRDDVKGLLAAAQAMDAKGNLLGADILLRRALALGSNDQATLDLYRKVEFILEDAPFRLPP